MPRYPDNSDNTHYASAIDPEECVSNTSASGIWTEGQNIHSDGGIFCPVCLLRTFYSWMIAKCDKCGYKRRKIRRNQQ